VNFLPPTGLSLSISKSCSPGGLGRRRIVVSLERDLQSARADSFKPESTYGPAALSPVGVAFQGTQFFGVAFRELAFRRILTEKKHLKSSQPSLQN